jgi:hypothetical protein
VAFVGGTNAKYDLAIQGTQTQVQMVVCNNLVSAGTGYTPNALYTGVAQTLQPGWNNVCVVYDNDTGANGNPSGENISMYMNTNFSLSTLQPLSAAVDGYQENSGPLSGSSNSTIGITVTRYNSTPGTGTVYLDNIGVSNTLTDPADAAWPSEAASYNPAPEPATLVLLVAGVVPLLRRWRSA